MNAPVPPTSSGVGRVLLVIFLVSIVCVGVTFGAAYFIVRHSDADPAIIERAVDPSERPIVDRGLAPLPPAPPRSLPELEKPRELDEQKRALDTRKDEPEPPIFFPENNDAVETPAEDFDAMKGDSEDFLGAPPNQEDPEREGQGGRLGCRLGGRRNLIARGGGSRATDQAVLEALRWLARHQNPDGSWRVTGYRQRCKTPEACAPGPGQDEYDAAVTGLAILAFVGSGYSHLSKDTHDGISFGTTVRTGLKWLVDHQSPEGCVGDRAGSKYMYGHAIGTAALCEAYALTGSNILKGPAQKAVDFIIAAQNPGKAWRYSFKSGDNDSSVAGWSVMALKAAEVAGLAFPRSSYEGATAWFDEVTEDAYHRVGYTHKGTGKVFVPGMNDAFDHHETLTAIGMLVRMFVQKNAGDARLGGGRNLLSVDLPKWNGNAIDFYYWHWGSLALFQLDGPAGPAWKKWNEAMKEAVVPSQAAHKDGCKRGSWEPVDRWSGEGGRVYATAINALTLETYFRYPGVFAK